MILLCRYNKICYDLKNLNNGGYSLTVILLTKLMHNDLQFLWWLSNGSVTWQYQPLIIESHNLHVGSSWPHRVTLSLNDTSFNCLCRSGITHFIYCNQPFQFMLALYFLHRLAYCAIILLPCRGLPLTIWIFSKNTVN